MWGAGKHPDLVRIAAVHLSLVDAVGNVHTSLP